MRWIGRLISKYSVTLLSLREQFRFLPQSCEAWPSDLFRPMECEQTRCDMNRSLKYSCTAVFCFSCTCLCHEKNTPRIADVSWRLWRSPWKSGTKPRPCGQTHKQEKQTLALITCEFRAGLFCNLIVAIAD